MMSLAPRIEEEHKRRTSLASLPFSFYCGKISISYDFNTLRYAAHWDQVHSLYYTVVTTVCLRTFSSSQDETLDLLNTNFPFPIPSP